MSTVMPAAVTALLADATEAAQRDDLPAAQAALEHAATLAPQLPLIPLILGEVLEARGLPLQATTAYFRAVLIAQQAGRWLDKATTPAPLRTRVAHAIAYAERGRRDVFAALLEPLRAQHGAASLARIERALAGYLGDRSVQPADPRQRPRFLYIPDLAAQPFHPCTRFEWMPGVVDAYPRVRAEALAMLADGGGVEPFLQFDDAAQSGTYLGGERPAWDALFFHRDGAAHAGNLARCPHTAALLASLPLVCIAGHAPEICFSVLRPDTHILPHHGVTNARLVVHLPLVIPPDCVLTVGGEAHAWREGEPVAFDDTYVHEAWNRSTQPRVILLMDAWHPDLTAVERIAVTTLVEGIGAFHRGG